MSAEVGLKRLAKVLIQRPTPLAARRTRRPYPLAPLPTPLPPRALRDPSVDHHEPQRLLRQVVGRLYPRRRDEAKVALTVLAKSLCQVARLPLPRGMPRRTHHARPLPLQRRLQSLRRHLLPPVKDPKELFQRRQHPLAILPVAGVQRGVRYFTSRTRCARQNCTNTPISPM